MTKQKFFGANSNFLIITILLFFALQNSSLTAQESESISDTTKLQVILTEEIPIYSGETYKNISRIKNSLDNGLVIQ